MLLIVGDDRRVSTNRTMHSCILLMVSLHLRACKRLRMVAVQCKRLLLREISRLSEPWLDIRARNAHCLLLFHNISNKRTPDAVGRRLSIPVAIRLCAHNVNRHQVRFQSEPFCSVLDRARTEPTVNTVLDHNKEQSWKKVSKN